MITDLYVTSEKKEKTELNKKIETKNNNMFSSLFKKKDK